MEVNHLSYEPLAEYSEVFGHEMDTVEFENMLSKIGCQKAIAILNYLSSYGKQYVCSQYISHLFARSLSEISLRTFGKDITSNLNIQ